MLYTHAPLMPSQPQDIVLSPYSIEEGTGQQGDDYRAFFPEIQEINSVGIHGGSYCAG